MSSRLSWKLEDGYSRFIRGSQLTLQMKAGPTKQTLKLSPAVWSDRSKPVELIFEQTSTGQMIPEWRVLD